jgi:Flp pilus assembly protein CpaB
MAVATLNPPRALRRPRRADPRALVGVFLTLAALGGSVAFWVGSSETRAVLIATHDLPAGATLRRADLGVAYLKMDDAIYAASVPDDMLEALEGRQLGEPVHAQQVLARAQVSNRLGLAADQVAITIPARPESAVDGRLRPGDSVQVPVTAIDKARNQAHTRQVLERAQVFEVGREQSIGSSSLGSDTTDGMPRGAITSVTLAVSGDAARQLAEARRTGELDVLLLPPVAAASR